MSISLCWRTFNNSVFSYSVVRSLAIASALLSLTACKTVPEPITSPAAQWLTDERFFLPRIQQIDTLNTWHYSAKVGVTTPRAREQANLVWQFADQANDVRLFGPLGVGAVRIEFDRFGVVLSDNKGVLHQGHSAEELLTRIVGWPIPIDALSYWLFALPNPELPFRYQVDDLNNVSVLQQQGWSIEYSAYRSYVGRHGQEHYLPRKLVATKQVYPDQQQVVVKLITKGWQW